MKDLAKCRVKNRRNRHRAVLTAMFFTLFATIWFASFVRAEIYRVSPDGSDTNDGSSWDFPKATIQEAVDDAGEGDEIWVKKGTYILSSQIEVSTTLHLYGEFNGTETERSERNVDVNNLETVIDGNDLTRCFYITAPATVDGFTIQNGSDSSNEGGGGIYISYSSPTISNCSFTENYSLGGGGMYIADSSPTITDCTFESNTAGYTGGGMYISNSSPTITDCAFESNIAYGDEQFFDGGGGMYIRDSSPTITNCTFTGNSATIDGGGIYNYNSLLTIINCTFMSNVAGDDAGGIYNVSSSTATIINSKFISNVASTPGARDTLGGAILNHSGCSATITNCLFDNNYAWNGGGIYSYHSENLTITSSTFFWNKDDHTERNLVLVSTPTTITNSIFWSLHDSGISLSETTPEISYSCCKNGCPGVGSNNTAAYPDWVDRDGPDDTMGTGDEDFRLKWDSPCVDSGNLIPLGTLGSATDIRGSLRPIKGDDDSSWPWFDMGAYEYSRDYSGQDGVTKAFENVRIDAPYALISTDDETYVYDILWENKNPFPDDNRITDQESYSVHLFLVNDDDIISLTQDIPYSVDITQSDYAYSCTFDQVGEWKIRLELADDPLQFVESEEIEIKDEEVEVYIIGEPIAPPVEALPSQKPDIPQEFDDAFYWSTLNNTLYAVAKVSCTLIWKDEDENPTIYQPVLSVWPEDPQTQIHIAGSPGVDLLDGSGYATVNIKYASDDATLEPLFTATEPGYAVLLYHSDEPSTETLEVVQTFMWSKSTTQAAVIGKPLEVPEVPDHDTSCGGGFVINENSPYAPNTQSETPYDGYDRATREGPIIPVNHDYSANPNNDLVVVWYQKGTVRLGEAEGVCWPSNPVRYDGQWPDPAPEIDIASMQGADTLKDYTEVQVYNQPDPDKPGCNPNEEHAFIYDGTVYALRNDLNEETVGGLSEPYVLVKYQDSTDDDKWKFMTFNVVTGSLAYTATAGELIEPPYPLSTFLPVCSDSYYVDAEGHPWWEDYQGNIYAKKGGDVEGDVEGVLRFFYPLQDGFFYDIDGDGLADVNEGECIPWLDRLADPESGGTPVDVHYTINWPDEGFRFPSGIAVDGAGKVYVADTGNSRIQQFDNNGVRQTWWGEYGTQECQFDTPGGIALDIDSGTVYVADTGNDRILKFSPAVSGTECYSRDYD